MISLSVYSRRGLLISAVAGFFFFAAIASAQCAGPSEEGRWHNLDDKGEPTFIDVKMLGCGDQVLNGQEAGASRYTLRVWVRQSTGKFYGRPTVNATYRTWKNQPWLHGNVTTGGYQDQMWLRVDTRDPQQRMHVLIKHQSLDSKPSASSEYWFVKAK